MSSGDPTVPWEPDPPPSAAHAHTHSAVATATGEPFGAPTATGAPRLGRDTLGRTTWGFTGGAALTPGRVILQPLGGGSRFEVFLVWDERRLALTVAKVLRPDRAADPTALADLRREAEALTRLAHPVLLRGFDAAVDGPFPHVLVEHLEGPSLWELLRDGRPLALEQLLPLALHVAAALHYLAAEGWVHLDVKPDNVIMGVPPRLIDLSVARPVADARALPVPVGTDAYMAPEQCEPARGPVGPAADVWGLGATLYHSVTARRPFPRAAADAASTEPARRWPQLVEPPRPMGGGIPRPLAELVLGALEANPRDRPTAAELAAGLEPLVAAVSRPRGRRA